MDVEEIKVLTDLVDRNGLSEIIVSDGARRIVIRRGRLPWWRRVCSALRALRKKGSPESAGNKAGTKWDQ